MVPFNTSLLKIVGGNNSNTAAFPLYLFSSDVPAQQKNITTFEEKIKMGLITPHFILKPKQS